VLDLRLKSIQIKFIKLALVYVISTANMLYDA